MFKMLPCLKVKFNPFLCFWFLPHISKTWQMCACGILKDSAWIREGAVTALPVEPATDRGRRRSKPDAAVPSPPRKQQRTWLCKGSFNKMAAAGCRQAVELHSLFCLHRSHRVCLSVWHLSVFCPLSICPSASSVKFEVHWGTIKEIIE